MTISEQGLSLLWEANEALREENKRLHAHYNPLLDRMKLFAYVGIEFDEQQWPPLADSAEVKIRLGLLREAKRIIQRYEPEFGKEEEE